MLAVISDLHFQHTSNDALRYVVDGAVQELEVRRNIPPEAFQRFFAQVHAIAEHRRSREVELVFAGDISGNFVAYDAKDGRILWNARIGNVSNAPQTYLIDGRQHVLVAAGDALFAFALRE